MILKQGFTKYHSTTKQLNFFFLRGLLSAASVFCFFYAASHIPLGIAAILFNTTPIFIPLLAILFLKEHTSFPVYAGIVISLIGVVVALHPGFNGLISVGSFIGLTAGFLMAISQVMLRSLSRRKESVDKIVFYQYLMCVVSALIIIGVETMLSGRHIGTLVHINMKDLFFVIAMLLILGILGFFAQRVLTKAFQYMAAAKLAPFLYVSVPISSIIGWVIWRQQFTISNGIGTILVVFGICIISFEKQLIPKFAFCKFGCHRNKQMK